MMQWDCVVIGGGPGGYVAALRAAQLGMRTACVEQRAALGGTCLHVGCIPSKALLHTSALYRSALQDFQSYGIGVSPELNLNQMMRHKEGIVRDLSQGIAYLFKKNKVHVYQGRGRLGAPGEVVIEGGADAGQTLSAQHIILATGSEVMPLPGVEIDEHDVVSSTGALSWGEVPQHLVVIGGGIIGLELGSVWSRLGSEVTVVEFQDRLCPGMDSELAEQVRKVMSKQGLKFMLGTKVLGASSGEVRVAKGEDAEETLACEKVLVAIGRRPVTAGLGLQEVGIAVDDRGFIVVDDNFKTSQDGVYAIGDCVEGPMLAHKAEDEGVVCVERLAGIPAPYHRDLIPGVLYTHPEVAFVGASEDELVASGIEYGKGVFSFQGNSRARAVGSTAGLAKVLVDSGDDRVLGVHIMAESAGELIHEAVAVMSFGGAGEDIARLCHAHPTFAEGLKEAALAAGSGAMHA